MKLLEKIYTYFTEEKALEVGEQGSHHLTAENKRLMKLVADQNKLLDEMLQANLKLSRTNDRLYRTIGFKQALIDLYIEKLEGKGA